MPPADAPVFVGGDLSQSDDLCAVVWVRMGADGRFYVDSHFWMPKATAEKYDHRDSIGYRAWAEAGHVTWLDSPTVNTAALQSIADAVVRRCGRKKPDAFCYDPYRADVCVKTLEAAGVPCVPIKQGNRASWNPSVWASYIYPVCVINGDTVTVRGITFPAGQLKMKTFRAKPVAENGIRYYQIEWTVACAEGWDQKLLSRGYYEKVDNKLRVITLANGKDKVSAPWPLDQDD